MKKNTTRYFEAIKSFREDLWELDEKYKPEYDHISKFKDSEHYAASKALLDKRRMEQVEGLRREHVNSGEYTLFRLDVDPADEADCLRIFGFVTDAAKFSAAVNGEVGA